jgi:hypothetical protein
MTEANHASLTYQDGLSAAGAVTFGSTHYPCNDFYTPCVSYIVTPTTDLLYFFPPPYNIPIDGVTYQDLQQFYLDLNLTSVEENTLVVVVGVKFGRFFDIPNPNNGGDKLVSSLIVFSILWRSYLSFSYSDLNYHSFCD